VDERLREPDRDEPGLFRQVERRALLEPRQRRGTTTESRHESDSVSRRAFALGLLGQAALARLKERDGSWAVTVRRLGRPFVQQRSAQVGRKLCLVPAGCGFSRAADHCGSCGYASATLRFSRTSSSSFARAWMRSPNRSATTKSRYPWFGSYNADAMRMELYLRVRAWEAGRRAAGVEVELID
jgi:hypothetical protein